MKIRDYFILLPFVIMSSAAFAQKDAVAQKDVADEKDTLAKTSGYFSFGVGGALPIGNFSSVTGSNLGSYATPGISAYLSAGILIKKLKFGFAIKEGWYTCGYSTNKYLTAAQAADSVSGRVFTRQGGGSKYNGGYGMVGLITDIKINKCILELRLMGGRLTAVFPEVTYSVSGANMTSSPTYDFSSGEAQAFAFEGGVSARIPLTKSLGFMGDIGYVYSSFAYGTSEQYTDYSGVQQTVGAYYNCTVNFLSITAGLAYMF